ncbi:MAG TPA: PDGLE domain-containing protein [Desulfomonilia bacterium]|nr:PDGLE domain-containing protein [Desulfomonilia bacterium]
MSNKVSTTKKLWIGLVVLTLLSPVGIIIPDKVKAGSAWGEWGTDEIQKMVGFVPQGMKKLADIWHAPMPDYAFKGWEEKGLSMLSLAYVISAAVGMGIITAITLLLGKILNKKE